MAHAQSCSCHAGSYIDSEGEGLTGKPHWSWLGFKFFHMEGSNRFIFSNSWILHIRASIDETKHWPSGELFRFNPVSNQLNRLKDDEIKSQLVSPSKCFFLWAQMCESLPFAHWLSRDGGVGVWRGLIRYHDRYWTAVSALCRHGRSALFSRY